MTVPFLHHIFLCILCKDKQLCQLNKTKYLHALLAYLVHYFQSLIVVVACSVGVSSRRCLDNIPCWHPGWWRWRDRRFADAKLACALDFARDHGTRKLDDGCPCTFYRGFARLGSGDCDWRFSVDLGGLGNWGRLSCLSGVLSDRADCRSSRSCIPNNDRPWKPKARSQTLKR